MLEATLAAISWETLRSESRQLDGDVESVLTTLDRVEAVSSPTVEMLK
jgi:hypothetical protein